MSYMQSENSSVSMSTSPTTTSSSSTTTATKTGHGLHLQLPKPPHKHVSKSVATVLSGGFAGCVAKTCTAPLTRVQLLSQTGATQESVVQTMKTVMNEKGFLNLWRGNLANCVRVFPHKSILFTINDIFRFQLSKYSKSGNLDAKTAKLLNSSYMYFITGATAGVIATIGTYPMDFILCNLTGTLEKNAETQVIDLIKTVYYRNGIFGFYKGLGATIGGCVPFEGTRIGVYNVLRDHIPKIETNYGNEPHPIGKLMAGATAGAAAGILTYPTDTVRRMLQVQCANGMPVYSGIWDCVRTNYVNHGMTRFYRGMPAKLARVIPDAAILFVVYEQFKYYFEDLQIKK